MARDLWCPGHDIYIYIYMNVYIYIYLNIYIYIHIYIRKNLGTYGQISRTAGLHIYIYIHIYIYTYIYTEIHLFIDKICLIEQIQKEPSRTSV